MAVWCVFCYQSVFFLPLVFIESCFPCCWSRRLKIFLWLFVWNSVGKKNTTCQGLIWIFPVKMLCFYTGFLMVLHKLTFKLWNTQKQMSRALPSSSHQGLRSPDPANQCSKKKNSRPALLCCTWFPGSVLYWHCLLTVSYEFYKHTFWHGFEQCDMYACRIVLRMR